jgi:hypothetical protein
MRNKCTKEKEKGKSEGNRRKEVRMKYRNE